MILKFRAWHLDDGMLYFDFDTFQKDYHDQYANIMLFTGLTDKNGKEAYEGDIYEAIGIAGDKFKRVIEWKKGAFWSRSLLSNDNFPLTFSPDETIDGRIIGSIYEIPELL